MFGWLGRSSAERKTEQERRAKIEALVQEAGRLRLMAMNVWEKTKHFDREALNHAAQTYKALELLSAQKYAEAAALEMGKEPHVAD